MSGKAKGAEEVHYPGLSAGGRNKARLDPWNKFRGVSLQPSGRYGAQIREPKGIHRWLGTFDTAEDAARAYDAAAVKVHGAAARTNFKQPAVIDGGGGASSLLHVRAEPSARRCHDGGTKFLGVCRQENGRFGARIRGSKGKSQAWIGTFDTAEDAARAYDAAAVKLRGARAITNFKQPAAVGDGVVSPLLSEPGGRAARRQPSGECIAHIRDRKGNVAVSLGGYDSQGMRHDELSVNLSPAEWQQVVELLKDMDSTDAQNMEALVKGGLILHKLAMDMAGLRESRTT